MTHRITRLAYLSVVMSMIVACRTSTDAPGSDSYVPIGYGTYGICLGNSEEWNGIRLNSRDRDVRCVNGVAVAWGAEWMERQGELRGLAFGLLGAGYGRATGVIVSPSACFVDSRVDGIALAGLGELNGEVNGLAAAGLLSFSKRLRGLTVAGIGTRVTKDFNGCAVAGGVSTLNGPVRGLAVSGLVTACGDSATGIVASSLASRVSKDLAGVAVALVSSVVGDDSVGLVVAGCLAQVRGPKVETDEVGPEGGGVVGRTRPKWGDFRGVLIGGLSVSADHLRGVGASLGAFHPSRLSGLGIGGVTLVETLRGGAVVGVFNSADDVEGLGIQFGVLNHIASNPWWARWLPLANARWAETRSVDPAAADPCR